MNASPRNADAQQNSAGILRLSDHLFDRMREVHTINPRFEPAREAQALANVFRGLGFPETLIIRNPDRFRFEPTEDGYRAEFELPGGIKSNQTTDLKPKVIISRAINSESGHNSFVVACTPCTKGTPFDGLMLIMSSSEKSAVSPDEILLYLFRGDKEAVVSLLRGKPDQQTNELGGLAQMMQVLFIGAVNPDKLALKFGALLLTQNGRAFRGEVNSMFSNHVRTSDSHRN